MGSGVYSIYIKQSCFPVEAKLMLPRPRLPHWIKAYLPARFRATAPTIPAVRLSGVIMSAGRLPLSQDNLWLGSVATALEKAFSRKDAPAVALIINSPGGSAVQSHLIHRRIRSLAIEHNKTVLAFVEDAAASGGYMIACAADDIFADHSSVIGSIGVISSGFGFAKALEKFGVERRVIAAGEHKGMLDPFQPLNPDDVERLKLLQKDVHELFCTLVRERRGAKLKKDEAGLFTGEFWSGHQALDLGLVDGIGDIRAVLRERFGDKTKIELVHQERGFLSRRQPSVQVTNGLSLPPEFAGELLHALEARSLWSRLGL